MSIPDWRTSTAGSRTRVALWLISEVGEGGTFTKAQLREAFPKVEQVDRRMRDLRAEGWQIATYREDRSLSADELRLVAVGGSVWEKGYTSQTAGRVSDRERQEIFAADGYACVNCGIAAGENYADDPLRTAKLTLSRKDPDADEVSPGRTVCDRCNVLEGNPESAAEVLSAIKKLDPEELGHLKTWIHHGQRDRGQADEVWSRYRRLPANARAEIAQRLSEL